MPILNSNRFGKQILFALDTPTPVALNAVEFYVRGWFISSPEISSGARTLGVIADKVFFPAVYGLLRPDVAESLNDTTLAKCGYYVRFRGPRLQSDVYVVVQCDSGPVALASVNCPPRAHPATPPRQNAQADSYDDWLLETEPGLFQNENQLPSWPYRPLVSVVLPASNPDLFFLERSIQSALGQNYPSLQLCVSSDYSSETEAASYLRQLAATDARVRLITNAQKTDISETSNRGIESAQGDIVVMLGQNDVLHRHAVSEVVRRCNERTDSEVIYSDEDNIDIYGSRSQPVFKPDIDLDMLLAFDCVGRLTAYKRDAIMAAGGFRSALDGVHAWDLLVRLARDKGVKTFQHIAKPIYHRGVSDVASLKNRRENGPKRSLRVLSDYLASIGQQTTIEKGIFSGSLRLRHEIPPKAKSTIFIRKHDGPFQLKTVLACSARESAYSIRQTDGGVIGLDAGGALPDVLIFINRPIESLNHCFLEELTAQALRKECGLVTGFSLDAEGRILHSGLVFSVGEQLADPFAGLEFAQTPELKYLNTTRAVAMISDEFFAVRREHLAAVNVLTHVTLDNMPELVNKLVLNSKQRGLRVLVTPFAIASFDQSPAVGPVKPASARDSSSIALNPNLLAFAHFGRAVTGTL
jgi:glycosyltransferase involved in cell wall biosynthesis